ncbi:hypothetical protein SAY87_013947 [Trapa incisa]|uniref:Uncharacterized protein n=1 Tax=Trapa incisa TaxID=236973 RepID=A0AAN7QDP7_9MYRT|nr:hypothetical protein SAY87_013947 [Trapa incisa]
MLDPQPTSLFRSQISAGRFDDGALEILQTLLISKDARSSVEVRSSLKQFMRLESLCALRGIAHRTVEQKLSVLEFFVKAFALIGDSEARILGQSCLALRYEALLLREFKSPSHHWLRVNCEEWINFAEHSLDRGFHSIAGKACANALNSLQKSDLVGVKNYGNGDAVVKKVQKLKDVLASASPSSVQTEAAGYLKKKTISKSKQSALTCDEKLAASSLFRDSIKKRNARKLQERQRLSIAAGSRMCREF